MNILHVDQHIGSGLEGPDNASVSSNDHHVVARPCFIVQRTLELHQADVGARTCAWPRLDLEDGTGFWGFADVAGNVDDPVASGVRVPYSYRRVQGLSNFYRLLGRKLVLFRPEKLWPVVIDVQNCKNCTILPTDLMI